MRSLYARQLFVTFTTNNQQVPSIKPDELLVKVRAASLCHSDLMLFEPNDQGLNLGSGDPFTMVRAFLSLHKSLI